MINFTRYYRSMLKFRPPSVVNFSVGFDVKCHN